MIEPIQTTYAGCRFRSRLEARWAVFLDTLRLPWEYEPQGYEFDGERYLPDFYLPRSDSFLEVKGEDRVLHEDLPRLRKFAQGIRKPVIILGEVPRVSESDESPIHPCLTLLDGSVVALSTVVMQVPDPDFVPVLASAGMRRLTTEVRRIGVHPVDAVVRAYAAARSARFEHGESGAA